MNLCKQSPMALRIFKHFFSSKRSILIWLSPMLFVLAMAQTTVKGLVYDKKTNEPLIGASILVQGSTLGTITNVDGMYELAKVPAGVQTLVVNSMSYEPQKVQVVLESGKAQELNVAMDEAGLNLSDVMVVTQRKTDTDLSMLSSIKLSTQVVSGVSSQQIGKTLDKDASEVVKRVPGVTIQDNRFIVVRGLNQRYNNVWLNNAATPSSETDVKAFSFDAVPSSMIDNLMIYKTGAPELSAEATGGFIKIVTKNIPDENFLSVEYTGQYNEQTTFKDTYRLDGSATDYLGYDDGTRALPSYFPADLNKLEAVQRDYYAKQLDGSWIAKKHQALPNQKLSINFGKRWALKQGARIGNITSINYSNTYATRSNMQNYQYEKLDVETETPVYLSQYHTNVYTDEFKLGVLHNWAYQISKDNRLEFKNLLNQVGVDKSSNQTGRNNYRQADFQYFSNQYSARTTYSGQLMGTHNLFAKETSKLDWVAGYSYANRIEPNRQNWSKKLDENTGLYNYVLPMVPSINELGRLYTENHENLATLASNFSQDFELWSIKPSLKTGFYGEYKDRNFTERSMCYRFNPYTTSTDEEINALSFDQLFTPTYLGTGKVLAIDEQTNVANTYQANNKLYAGYLALNLPVSKLNVYAGVRVEKNVLQVDGYYDVNTEVHVSNDVTSLCPSINTSYNFNKKNLMRLAYAKTVNRPEFREVAPLSYYDFTERFSVAGNPDLVDAQIHNVDLRYEFYPSPSETFTLAAFYKNFTNPIEMVSVGSSDYSFQNAKTAENYGLEIELKKSLEMIGMKNFSVTANASYIYSLVKFENMESDKNRPLQGQSPFVINTALFYQNDKAGLSASLAYNVMGERIVVAAEVNQGVVVIPDIYEMPRHVVDFMLSKKLGKHFELKFGAKDILAQDFVTQQTFDYEKDGVAKSKTVRNKVYNLGRTWSLGASFKL